MGIHGVTNPAASFEMGLHVVQVMRKMWKAKFPVCSRNNASSQELLDKPKLTNGDNFLVLVGSLLIDPTRNTRRGRKEVNPHWFILTLEKTTDMDALCKRLI